MIEIKDTRKLSVEMGHGREIYVFFCFSPVTEQPLPVTDSRGLKRLTHRLTRRNIIHDL